jgi:hypothetical protein
MSKTNDRFGETPDAVLSAMETETSPLPDAVAAAWDVALDPPGELEPSQLMPHSKRKSSPSPS